MTHAEAGTHGGIVARGTTAKVVTERLQRSTHSVNSQTLLWATGARRSDAVPPSCVLPLHLFARDACGEHFFAQSRVVAPVRPDWMCCASVGGDALVVTVLVPEIGRGRGLVALRICHPYCRQEARAAIRGAREVDVGLEVRW